MQILFFKKRGFIIVKKGEKKKILNPPHPHTNWDIYGKEKGDQHVVGKTKTYERNRTIMVKK